ncbi:uncharacterized protein [Porites lutea]|uniref:uncharacterized protein isoform X3 n=1 Tax=Porites lutea TaxID=51062 RepID=UPI003CC517B1
MTSEVLGTPGDKTALESQGISGTDEVTETMQILEAQGMEKVQDMDEVMQIDESLTIPELEEVSMDTPTGHAGNCTTCKTLRSEVTQLRGKVTRLKSWIYKEKTFERNRRELFSFPNFFFCFSSATCASFQNPNFLYHRQVPC